MTEIQKEKRDFFFRVKNIKDCRLLAFYEYDDNCVYLYEKNNVPMFFSCDKNGNNQKGAAIPFNLFDLMKRLSDLEDKERATH